MMDGWNIGQKKVRIARMFALFHHSPILQHSTTPLLHRSVKARGDWSKKDIAIVTPYCT
jgi:hypothetical protein